MGFEQETTRSLQRPRASNAKMMFGISSSLKFIFSNPTYFNISPTTKCTLLWLFSFIVRHFVKDKLILGLVANQFTKSKFTQLELGP